MEFGVGSLLPEKAEYFRSKSKNPGSHGFRPFPLISDLPVLAVAPLVIANEIITTPFQYPKEKFLRPSTVVNDGFPANYNLTVNAPRGWPT
jgi:hypothetical protein